MTVVLKAYDVPQPGIYKFSDTVGFSRLNNKIPTKRIQKNKPKKGLVIYVNGSPAIQPPKKTLDVYEARKIVQQLSPLMKLSTDKK